MSVPLSDTRLDLHRRLSALSRKPYGDMETALAELLAEVDRLNAEAAKEERAHLATIDERDHAQDMADKLAYAIAPMEVIGEHSSDNCPWTNAEEEAHALHAKVKELGRELADTAMMRDFYQRSAEHVASQRDRFRSAWRSARNRAAVLSAEITRRVDGAVAIAEASMDGLVRCRRPHCPNAERFTFAADRGWARVVMDSWLCPEHAALAAAPTS